jgi:hypothetical protein
MSVSLHALRINDVHLRYLSHTVHSARPSARSSWNQGLSARYGLDIPVEYDTCLNVADEQCSTWTLSLNSFLYDRVVNFVFSVVAAKATSTFTASTKASSMTVISGAFCQGVLIVRICIQL